MQSFVCAEDVGCIDQRFLDIDTCWRSAVSSQRSASRTRGKSPQYLSDSTSVGPNNGSAGYEDVNILYPLFTLPELEPLPSDSPHRSQSPY
jgi:hypothetical protein